MERPIMTAGYKKGEIDFGINASVCDLSYEQMKDFREMIVVAIGVAEDMWRRYKEKDTNQGSQEPAISK